MSRSVVVEAYEQLIAEGYLDAVQGSGTRVADQPTAAPTRSRLSDSREAPRMRWDLRAGTADVTNFPLQEWLSCYQRTVQHLGPEKLVYPPISGTPSLRQELASYLGRVRGVQVEPEHVMVTMGFAQGLSLLCKVLPRLGIDAIGIEDPGSGRQQQFITDTGMRPVPIPVDTCGLDVAALAKSGVRAVLITPAHQFPTGVTMSTARREALLKWAEEVDGLIIEDDYDTEFWFDRRERPLAVQNADPERVVYAGSLSKVLAPGLRLGWLAMPPRLFRLLEQTRAGFDQGSDSLTQLAVAEFLRSGLLDRHLRRLRPRYRARWETLTQAVHRNLRGAEILGSAAGRHLYVELPRGTDEAALVAGAHSRSVLVRGGQHFRFTDRDAAPALVIGYSSMRPSDINEALAAIGAAYEGLSLERWTARRPGAVISRTHRISA